MHNCFLHVKHWEGEQNVSLSHLVRLRPDLMIMKTNVGFLDLREHGHHVAIKAREIIFSTDTQISSTYMSHKDCYFVRNAGGTSKPHVERMRMAMHKWHVPFTTLLDDQFAVLPRVYGEAYFLQASFNASNPSALPDFGFTRKTLPNPEAKEAVRVTYGAVAGPEQLCWTYFYHNFVGLFNSLGGYDVGHDHTHLCCERMLTWRLVGRLVPYRLVPFQLGLRKYMNTWSRDITLTC